MPSRSRAWFRCRSSRLLLTIPLWASSSRGTRSTWKAIPSPSTWRIWCRRDLEPGDAPMTFGNITQAIEDLRNGKPIIVADDEDRENEGDLILAAELITPE